MAKTSKTKGFDDRKDPRSCLVPGPGLAVHHIADAAQASLTNQGVIVRQRAWAREARLSESDA